MCYYKWKAWYKLLPSSGLKKNICACFYHPHQTNIFLNVVGHAQNIVHQIFCTAVTLKRNELTVYISLKEANCHVLQIAKTQFRYTIWFGIFWKKYYEVHVSSLWWCTHVPKVSANKAFKKNCVPEFPIFQSLKITFMFTCDFYRYEHV